MLKWYDRVLLVILLLCILLVAGVMIAIVPAATAQAASGMLQGFLRVDMNRYILVGVGILLALIAIRLFVGMAGHKPAKGPDSVLIANSAEGSANIALTALEAMVLRCASKHNAVRDVQTKLRVTENNSLMIYLKILAAPDVVLPEVTTQLQNNVKGYVEQYAGIPVMEVVVLVDAAPVQKNAVPARVE